ncbi:MAG: hypothetical protein KAI99_05200 [Cyclobacteriaceae bacterium]|nr:hypothetical protein [Cyclobacteriaceae bacterium]
MTEKISIMTIESLPRRRVGGQTGQAGVIQISYNIVKAHSGSIVLETVIGKGLQFTISIPSNSI